LNDGQFYASAKEVDSALADIEEREEELVGNLGEVEAESARADSSARAYKIGYQILMAGCVIQLAVALSDMLPQEPTSLIPDIFRDSTVHQ
jgi:hypothetical protein